MPGIVELAPNIMYLPASHEPLSADVFAIQGECAWWIFDVGDSKEALDFINGLPCEAKGKRLVKNIVISHFHVDHMGNLLRALRCEISMPFDELYVGTNTFKYTRIGQVVDKPMSFSDGVQLQILPVPNSHAKGSLALVVNGEFAFLGDSTYPQVRPGRDAYNVQLLGEEIKVLQGLNAKSFCLSHKKFVVKEKESVLSYLEKVYSKRQKNEPCIYVNEI